MGTATMAAVSRVSPEEILELERISSAQVDAARAGNFEEVRSLLGTRQRLLDGLRGRVTRPGDLESVMASDAETIVMLRTQIRQVEEDLARVSVGGRAIQRYAVRTATPPGFLDHVR